uniref:Uncharacterized protein n=1 Tax=Meloidogyne incognita TaxID=6306 RepID=A0A914KQT7_MELIC
MSPSPKACHVYLHSAIHCEVNLAETLTKLVHQFLWQRLSSKRSKLTTSVANTQNTS